MLKIYYKKLKLISRLSLFEMEIIYPFSAPISFEKIFESCEMVKRWKCLIKKKKKKLHLENILGERAS